MPSTPTRLLLALFLLLPLAACSDDPKCGDGVAKCFSREPDAAPDLPVDLCAGVSCGPGSCDPATGTCNCPTLNPGYRCEGFLDPPCLFVGTCGEHGTCQSDSDPASLEYSCTCRDGWTGTNCEIPPDLCAGVDCGPGSCDPVTGMCSCPTLYSGDRCEVISDPPCFVGNPCGEHGTCIEGDEPTTYTCMCGEGWSGMSCEVPLDPCAGVDCGPGSCDAATLECSCPAFYSGERCELIADFRCEDGAPCGEHGTCADLSPTQSACTCELGWEGRLCDQPIP